MKELAQISEACGLHFAGSKAVSGGDINRAYEIWTTTEKFFLKLNNSREFPDMFAAETKGLHTLLTNTNLKVPRVIKNGVTGETQYLLIEWLDKGVPVKSFWEDFGAGLAAMHKESTNYFGFDGDNYIGCLPQKNEACASWPEFYAAQRILPLVKQLYNNGSFSPKDVTDTEALCAVFSDLFPEEPPALLHGDLWSGNFLTTSNGCAAIFDPSVYYGHREMDIGMSLLFGGFDRKFYDAYNSAYPLQTGWEGRVRLAQLYSLLVHAVLFGGHYISSAANIIRQYK